MAFKRNNFKIFILFWTEGIQLLILLLFHYKYTCHRFFLLIRTFSFEFWECKTLFARRNIQRFVYTNGQFRWKGLNIIIFREKRRFNYSPCYTQYCCWIYSRHLSIFLVLVRSFLPLALTKVWWIPVLATGIPRGISK